MSYVYRILKDRYTHNVTRNQVCALLGYLICVSGEADTLSSVKITASYSESKVYNSYGEAIYRFFNNAPTNGKFRVDIEGNTFRIDSCNNESSANADESFKGFLSTLRDDSESEYEELCRIGKIIEREGIRGLRIPCSSNDNTENKEDIEMSRLFPELKCGKVGNGAVKMSHLGVAVKNREGVYVAYDKTAKKITDVDAASIDGGSFLYQMPVQTSDIKVGDCIMHNNAYFYITSTSPLKGICYYDGTEDAIQLTANMFGFNFVTKIVSIMDLTTVAGGNNMMLPLLLMSDNEDCGRRRDGSSSNGDVLKMMVMMQCMQPTNGQAQAGTTQASMNNMFSNPMMILALAGNGGLDTSALLMYSMMQTQQAAPVVENK